MNIVPGQDINDFLRDAGIRTESIYFRKGGLNDDAFLRELAGVGEDDGAVGGILHIFHGLHPHQIVAGKTGLGNEAVGAHKELIHKELLGTFADKRAYLETYNNQEHPSILLKVH